MPDTLGTILTAARYRKGWSLCDAERETGVPNAHISQIETGKIRQPHVMTLGQLALGYDLPMRDLIEAAGYLDAQKERARLHEDLIRANERERIVMAVSALQRPAEMGAFMKRHALHRRCGPEQYIVSLAAEISRMGDR